MQTARHCARGCALSTSFRRAAGMVVERLNPGWKTGVLEVEHLIRSLRLAPAQEALVRLFCALGVPTVESMRWTNRAGPASLRLVGRLTHVQRVTFHGCTVNREVFVYLSQMALRELYFTSCVGDQREEGTACSSPLYFPNLRVFRLSLCLGILPCSIIAVVQSSPQLQALSITPRSPHTLELDLGTLFSITYASMEDLKLNGYTSTTLSGGRKTKGLVEKLPALKQLYLNTNLALLRAIDDDSAFVQLRFLEISGPELPNDAMLVVVSRCPHLRSLRLSLFRMHLTHDFVHPLAALQATLEELELSFPGTPDAALATFLRDALPRLVTLKIPS